MPIEPSTEIAFRYDFPLLCNARGYKDAVEIGLDQGIFAKHFLERFAGNWLYCIDPYERSLGCPFDRECDMHAAILALAPYHERYRIVRARSVESVPWVTGLIKPEFVYIDGSHAEADVLADLETWWGVLPDHGMIAGHDYRSDDHPGVVAAVNRFATERNLVVRLTHEKDSPPSFYIYKREPEQLFHRFFHEGVSPNPHGRAAQ